MPDDKTISIVGDSVAPPQSVKLRRRGSVTDIDTKSLKNRDIFSTGYELIRQQFPAPDPIHQQDQRYRRRFVCGHPGCGKAFTNHEVAVEHQKTHLCWFVPPANPAQPPGAYPDFHLVWSCSTRLGVASGLTDQYFRLYWPAKSPWKTTDMIQRTVPPATMPCVYEGCQKSFVDKEGLARHLRCGHTKYQLKQLGIPSISGVEWTGSPRSVSKHENFSRWGIRLLTVLASVRPQAGAPL
jgi:hypothetical protein